MFFALCSTVTLDEVAAVIKPFVSLYVASGQALSVLYRLLRAEVESTSTSQRSTQHCASHYRPAAHHASPPRFSLSSPSFARHGRYRESLMMGTTANERTGCIHNRRASHAAARTHAHDAVRLELRATSRRTLRAPNRAAVGGHHLSQLVVVRGAPATNTTTRSPRIELAFLFPPPPR